VVAAAAAADDDDDDDDMDDDDDDDMDDDDEEIILERHCLRYIFTVRLTTHAHIGMVLDKLSGNCLPLLYHMVTNT
jgi:hypothetical protein